MQEKGHVLYGAEDGGLLGAEGTLKGDGLGREEWASGGLEIGADAGVGFPRDAVGFRSCVQL